MDIEHRIKNLILNKGKISVARFMQEIIATDDGYYNNNQAIGKKGDFTTSPEVSQLFGEMIGIWCVSIWYKLKCPKNLSMIEFGPGKASLINDILRSTKHVKDFHSSLTINFIEKSKRLRTIQQNILNQYNISTNWFDSYHELQIYNEPIIVIANEFFDALPISQYKKHNNLWYETYIVLNDSFEFEFKDLTLNSRDSYNLDCDYKNIDNNSIIEISIESNKIISYLCEIIKANSGAALVIDYGYSIEDFSNIKTHSTLQSIKEHSFNHIFKNIGEADITAHVDFCRFSQIAKLYNLKVKLCSQREFLINHGILIRAQMLSTKLDYLMKQDLYSRLDRLVATDKMGELFKTLELIYIN